MMHGATTGRTEVAVFFAVEVVPAVDFVAVELLVELVEAQTTTEPPLIADPTFTPPDDFDDVQAACAGCMAGAEKVRTAAKATARGNALLFTPPK